jgi:hypothetical protein
MFMPNDPDTMRSRTVLYPDCNALKKSFSKELTTSLQREYGGRIPSIATVARDFSLRAPHLKHISGEAIRKWLSGSSVPHMSRMSVLVEWLGPELREVFERKTSCARSYDNSAEVTTPVQRELIETALQLSSQDAAAALTLLRDLLHTHHEAT